MPTQTAHASALPSNSAPSRRERRSAELRNRIYQAALRLFANRGYAATTVEDITESADVGKGTFFNYFASKEHVLAAFGDQRLAHFEQALAEVRSGSSGAGAALRSALDRLSDLSPADARIFRSIFAAHACSDSVCEHLRIRIARCQRIITKILILGQKSGEVRRDCHARDEARMLQQALLGVTMGWSINPQDSLQKLTRKVWAALWNTYLANQRSKIRISGLQRN